VNVEPDYGGWKAQQLVVELQEMLSNVPVQIHHGRKIVEVQSIFVNKGKRVSQLKSSVLFDHALYAGDDESDETMFSTAGENDVSVKVGDGDTAARYRVPSPEAMRQLIARFLAHQQAT
jgi:trehalose-phosphatase